VLVVAFAVRSQVPSLRRTIRVSEVLFFCIINCAILIGVAFAAGRMTTFPLQPGVVRMNDGCCGQGLVFPQDRVPPLADWLSSTDGHADLRIDQFAVQNKLARLALVPSVLQHGGSFTSTEEDLPEDVKNNRSLAARVWNFGFEQSPGPFTSLPSLPERSSF
jgi:hypothetical protein